jgi:septal ring factor EnvC (AmiA/AmiB activator)
VTTDERLSKIEQQLAALSLRIEQMEEAYPSLDVQANDLDTDVSRLKKDMAEVIETVNAMVKNWPKPAKS